MHILIIEDEALVALDLQMLFEELGAQSCTVAATQAEAVTEALRLTPDLIASDVNLLEGNGPGAVKTIRSHLGPIPAVYITGNPDLARAADPDALVIGKPVRKQDLAEIARRYGLHWALAPQDPDAGQAMGAGGRPIDGLRHA